MDKSMHKNIIIVGLLILLAGSWGWFLASGRTPQQVVVDPQAAVNSQRASAPIAEGRRLPE